MDQTQIDQIAAKAWDKIMCYYGIQIADGTGLYEIKAAIEKAVLYARDEAWHNCMEQMAKVKRAAQEGEK